MEEINHTLLEAIKNNKTNKSKKCNEITELMTQFFYHNNNIFKYIKSHFDVYQLALWIKSREFFIERKEQYYVNNYKPRDIVFVDLGDNIGSELSYKHPCVVIKNDRNNIFVVPCSSSIINDIYVKGTNIVYNEYIIGEIVDGFSKQTVLILNNAKWISKARIVQNFRKPKQISKDFYLKVYDKLFKYIFTYKQQDIEALERKIKYLEYEVMLLKEYN